MILAMVSIPPFTGVLDPYLQEQTFNSAFELHMHYITFLSNFVYFSISSQAKQMFPHMSMFGRVICHLHWRILILSLEPRESQLFFIGKPTIRI